MHRAPWTKVSISMGELRQMCSMASRESSRERTTRDMPSSAQRRTPSREWTVSWVEPWTARPGAACRSIRRMPRSWMRTASTPTSAAWAATWAAAGSSRSVTRVLRVR